MLVLMQKTAFSLVKSRLALSSPGCFVVRLGVTMPKIAKGSPSDGERVVAIIETNGNEYLVAEAFSTAKASKSLWGEVGLFQHLQMPTT